MHKARVKKLWAQREPKQPIIVLMPGEEPTAAQLEDMARARAAGIEPHILQIVKASEGGKRN